MTFDTETYVTFGRTRLILTKVSKVLYVIHETKVISVADPGFSVWGWGTPSRWGHPPPMQPLFGKNVCKNENIRSCWEGGRMPAAPPPWIRQ